MQDGRLGWDRLLASSADIVDGRNFTGTERTIVDGRLVNLAVQKIARHGIFDVRPQQQRMIVVIQ